MTNRFDAIVIGTGQAEPHQAPRRGGHEGRHRRAHDVRRRLRQHRLHPNKAMVASAYAAHMARRAADFGVAADGRVTVDMRRVKARKDAISAASRTSTETSLSQSNSSMMEVDFPPPRLIVVGGSYAGLEFAQMFRRFGSEVAFVEKGPRLIAREDEDVSDAIRKILEREGIEIRLNAECISFSRRGGGTVAHVGRRPNTGDLGLEKAGVAVDERGYIRVDYQLGTSAVGIWALGDCNGKGAFTHTSYNASEIVAANLLDHDPRRVSDRIPAYALYIDPPPGRAGMTEAEVRKSGRPALAGKRLMTHVARAVEKGESQGFMKIVVDALAVRLRPHVSTMACCCGT